MNRTLSVFLLSASFASLLLVVNLDFGVVQAQTPVSGVIRQDTTWTKANSPYVIMGPTSVDNGVTLRIEPGVTVELGNYYLQVNGTLIASGSGSDPIHINGGYIDLTELSTSWNAQTATGSTIENAIIKSYIQIGGSPKIARNTFIDTNNWNLNIDISVYSGSPIITDNNMENGGISLHGGGSPVITNNVMHNLRSDDTSSAQMHATLTGNHLLGFAQINGSPIITDNIFNGCLECVGSGTFTIKRNTIQSPNQMNYDALLIGVIRNGVDPYCNVLISENIIFGGRSGISCYTKGAVTIEGNTIYNNTNGIISSGGTIENNNIKNNSVGVILQYDTTEFVFTHNNILNNIECNFVNHLPKTISIADNWWGTTDQDVISKTIYDSNEDFNVGTVNFTPYSTSPNLISSSTENITVTPEATTTPALNSTQKPTQEPIETPASNYQSPVNTQTTTEQPNWLEIIILVTLVVISVLLAGIFVRLRRNKSK